MDFQSIPLHITYSSQHFESIQYVNGLSRFLPTFQINNPKVTIDLNDFPSFLESNYYKFHTKIFTSLMHLAM